MQLNKHEPHSPCITMALLSAYNKPKSENASQPRCTLEKERAITEALKHFEMI